MPNDNPFQDPLRFERQAPECAVVIFGANGDLTKRKLIPALYRLAYDRRLAAGFAVVGTSRTPMTDDQFREKMREWMGGQDMVSRDEFEAVKAIAVAAREESLALKARLDALEGGTAKPVAKAKKKPDAPII